MLYNLSDDFFHIKQGDRIAQMILQGYANFDFQVVEDFETTERGSGGFGSTNTQQASFDEEGD
jgi:dUTP pyrophosphatase